MNKTEFDEKMKNMLHECADDLHAPDTMKTRVDFALRSAQVKPRHRWHFPDTSSVSDSSVRMS